MQHHGHANTSDFPLLPHLQLNRIKELRDLRKSYLDKVAAIKESTKGLDCKTEAELDARIKAQEDLISGGGISIREEKIVVSEISKLRAQREKIKGFEGFKVGSHRMSKTRRLDQSHISNTYSL